MTKKIFKVIGLILGCTTAFVGCVVGVLAIQGKFKTPIIYPEEIHFADSEMIITTGRNNSTIYSFSVTGTNSSEEYAVNQTGCEIWIESGAEFIELCTKDGSAWPEDKVNNKFYSTDVNQEIYFKLKQLSDTVLSTKDNKVVLNARTANGKPQIPSSNKQTIYIDRKVESVCVDEIGNSTEATIGLETELVLNDYVFNPIYSQSPYTNESGVRQTKIVELYFDGTSKNKYLTDYLLVNEGSIATDKILKEVLTLEDGQLTFKVDKSALEDGTSLVDTYNFKLAVFESFEAKSAFELQYPEGTSNSVKLQKMYTKDVKINVVNEEISEISMTNSDVVLSLYEQTNLLLNSTASSAKDVNLALRMYKSNSTMDSSRYDNITFLKSVDDLEFAESRTATFVNENDETQKVTAADTGFLNSKLKKLNIYIGGWQVIDYYEDNGEKYYCGNGTAVVNGTEVKVLKTNTYLMFCKKDTNNDFVFYPDFKFETEKENQTYKITATTPATLDDKIYLCAFVVNNGKNIPSNLFESTAVRVDEYDLDFTRAKETAELNVNFDANGIVSVDSQALSFSDFVTDIKASYKACVFVTEYNVSGYDVETISKDAICFVTGEGTEKKTYVLVGSLDANGNFTNEIKANYNSNAQNGKETTLYLLQLKNEYGDSTETCVKKLVASLTSSKEISLTESQITNLSDAQYQFTITTNYNFNKALFNVALPSQDLYEGDEYTLTLTTNDTTKERIKDFYNFYIKNSGSAIEQANFLTYIKSSKDSLFTVKACAYSETDKKITITIECKKETTADNLPYLMIMGENYNAITIKSSKPETIVYRYGSGETEFVELSNSSNDLSDNAYVKVKISWNGSAYVPTLNFVVGSDDKTLTLNTTISANDNGFNDKLYKGVAHSVTYASGNEEIFTINANGTTFKAVGTGETYLKVTIAGVSAYVKVVVSCDKTFTLNKTSSEITNDGVITEIAELLYDGANILSSDNAVDIVDVEITFGKIGSITKDADSWTYKYDGTEILKITNDNGWKFSRPNMIYVSMNVQVVIDSVAIHSLSKADRTLTFAINSGITTELNANGNWILDGKVVLYKGTQVNLKHMVTGTNKLEGYYDLIGIKSKNDINNSNLHIYLDNGEITSPYTINATYGEHTISVKYSGDELFSQKVYVMPNAVVEGDITTLTANTNIDMSTFEIKSHSTTASYGTTGCLYRQNHYTAISDYDNISVIFSDGGLTGTITGANLVISMSKIGTITTDVTIKCDGEEIKTFENVVVSNNYSVEYQTALTDDDYTITSLTSTNIENCFRLKNGDEYDSLYSLQTLEIHYDTETILAEITSSAFTIPAISKDYQNAYLVLTYQNASEQNLTYTTDSIFNISAYRPTAKNYTIKTGEETNLINKIYDADSNIKTYEIEAIYEDINGETNYANQTGFSAGSSVLLTFNDFEGKENIVYVKFKLTYQNDTTYSYILPVTITNKSQITLTYPMNDLKFTTNDNIVFIKENDRTNFGTDSHNYEPVAIAKSGTSKTIDFINADTQYDVTRISTTDFKNLELVGYSSLLYNYVKNITIANGGVVLPANSNEIFGYLIFKVTTNSLNYDYYTLYICRAETSSVNKDIELSNASGTNVVDKLKEQVTTANFGYAYEETKISFYYLSSSSLASYVSGLTEYSKISSENEFADNDINYASLKFVVLYTYGYQIYPLGTLTMHLQPTNIETADTSYLKQIDGIHNGKYTKQYDAVVTTINNPFDKSIQNITLTKLDGSEIDTGMFTISACPISVGDVAITINKFKTTAYSFVAIYTTNDGLKLQVTYTLYPVTVTEPTNNAIEVGKFEDETFKNSVTIASIIGTNYASTIKINNSTYTDTTYTFTQSAQDQLVELKFTFDNLLDESGNSIEKTYRFKVLKAYNKTTAGENNGSTSSTALATTANTTYTTTDGNKLNISKSTNSGIDTYIIGSDSLGQIIKVASGSKLKLCFGVDSQYSNSTTFQEKTIATGSKVYGYYTTSDDINYNLITSKTEVAVSGIKYYEKYVELTSGTTLNFVHMATSRVISAQVEVVDNSENIYTTYDLYINLQKSYSGIQAVYCASGATHENIVEDSSISTLFAKMFTDDETTLSGATRISLLDNDGNVASNVDFEAMGFNDKNNPNYIVFETFPEQKISIASNTTLNVDAVDENTIETLRISNNSGMEYIDYSFQIMNGTEVDGFNFDIAEEDGLYENNMASITAGADKIVYLGKLKDLNGNLFTISDITPSDISITIDENNISVKDYAFSNGIHLYYDANTNSVYTQLDGFGSEKSVTKTITATGTTGYVFDGLTLAFYNYSVVKSYDSTADTQNALTTIGVNEFIKMADGSTLDSELKLAFDSMTYSFNSQGLQNSSAVADNTLIKFDYTTQELTFKNIGASYAYAEIVFKVQKSGQTIRFFTYTVKIVRSMQFVVNNQDFGNASANEIETYLKLTGGTKSYTLQESSTCTETPTDDYYTDLYISLGDINKGKSYAMSWTTLVSVEISSDYSSIVEYSDSSKTLTFLKDYTGDVVLNLVVDTGTNGTYQIDYVIHVLGHVSVAYINSAKEYCLITGNGAISSGDSITIIGSNANSALSYAVNNSSVAPTLTISHVICELTDTGLSNEDLFTGASVEDYTGGMSSTSKTIIMPDVPISSATNTVYYRVVYKITVNKGDDFDEENYYVSYKVKNTLPITELSANVCVNDRLSGNYLDLFYYNQTSGATYFESGNIKSVFNCAFTDQTSFTSFVTNKVIGIGDNYFNLVQIDGYRYGIYLAVKYSDIGCSTIKSGNLFTNEYVGNLVVYSAGEAIITLPAYTGTTGFRLYTNTTITAKSSMEIANVFNSYSIPDDLKDLSIIGVGASASTNWVNGTSVSLYSSVDTGLDVAGYSVYKLTYKSSSGVAGVCDVSATYYAVIGVSKVVVVDYNAAGAVDCFEVQSGKSLNLSECIKTYSMDSGILTVSSTEITSVSGLTAGMSYSSNILTQSTPDGSEHTISVTAGGKTFSIKVKFLTA